MKIYFCWHGERSLEIANLLGDWISQVIQAIEPWISTEIDKGARWLDIIGSHLEEAKIGIVCLTPENLTNPWIHFESGAISKTKDSHLCTFLLNLTPNDVPLPLSQFQHTEAKKDDVKKLINTVNNQLDKIEGKALPGKILDKSFDTFWNDFEKKLNEISKRTPAPPVREQTQTLDEILTTVRTIAQQKATSPGTFQFGNLPIGPSTIIVTSGTSGESASAEEGKGLELIRRRAKRDPSKED